MTESLVSVIIPTFNRKSIAQRAIESVLKQTYKNIEIIVVDDGSTDGTDLIIKRSYNLPNIKYIYKENGGCGSALNKGIKNSSGDFICWLSSDDYYYDANSLKIMLSVFKKKPEVMVTYSDFFIEYDNASKFTTSHEKMTLHKAKHFDTKQERYMHNFKECLMNGSTTMFRKEIFKNVGMFNECYRYCQDWDLWFRILYDYEVQHINKPLTIYSAHKDAQGLAIMDSRKVSERQKFEKEKMLVAKHQRLWLNRENRPTVCAMLCVKDEEEMIEQCLDDIIQWADKIVIFDDGSTDRTPELIRQYPKVVDIHRQKNKGNKRTEGKDRQKLLDMAKNTECNWIFFIDTDEICEMQFKWDLYDLICDKNINLYYMKELNLWRCLTHRRIDEMYDKGWFGRMLRNFSFLKIHSEIDEHCCGIPYNIPGASPWYSETDTNSKKIDVGMIHYGFAYWERMVKKYADRMERDPYRFDEIQGRWIGGDLFYSRMIDTTVLELKSYEYIKNQMKIVDDYIVK